MQRFCSTIGNRRIADDLKRSLSGKGAFRKFKAAVPVHGIDQSWYKFRDEAYEEIGKEWCEDNGLSWSE